MILNGHNRRLDCVADTNLETPAVFPARPDLKVSLRFLHGPECHETAILIHSIDEVHCWDVIWEINDHFDSLEIGGILVVHDVYVDSGQMLIIVQL